MFRDEGKRLGLLLVLEFRFSKCGDGGVGCVGQVGVTGLPGKGSIPHVPLSGCLSISLCL